MTYIRPCRFLPDPPEHFKTAARAIALSPRESDKQNPHLAGPQHLNRTLYLADGSTTISVALPRYRISEEFESWCRENISDQWSDAGVSISYNHHRSSVNVIHTDRTRDFNLLYILEPGGKKPLTKFYQEKNQPVIRPGGTYVEDFRLVEELHSEYLVPGVWYLLDGRILHNVQDLESMRVFLSLGFFTEPFKEREIYV